MASVPKLEAQWKIIHEFKPTEYPQLYQGRESFEMSYDGGFDDGGTPNLTIELKPHSLYLYLRCPDFNNPVFRIDQLPKLQEWTRIEISHVEEGGQLFLSFTVGGQTKRRQASQLKGNLSNLTDVKIYIGDEQPGFVKGLMVLDQK